jgi:hypothetical protein
MSSRWEAFAVALPLFLAFHWAAASHEEEHLRQKFGESYARYAGRVGAVLPRSLAILETGEFTVAQAVRNREPATFGLGVALVILFGLQAYGVLPAPGYTISRLLGG